MQLLHGLVGALLASAAIAAPITNEVITFNEKVSADVVRAASTEGTTSVFIRVSNSLNPISLVENREFASRAARTTYVYEAMRAHMMATHAPLHSFLAEFSEHFSSVQSFWITNSLFIEGADSYLISELSKRSDVVEILPDEIVPLVDTIESDEEIPQILGNEWGVERIGAPQVWAAGNRGEGIVVANIDTGVRYTHEALKGSYRGNLGNGQYSHDYNYYDARGGTPQDYNGHGSHVMGTIAGTNGIGVAPGAKWIAAVGCRSSGCSTSDLTSSAQWMVCPTKVGGGSPDCSKAPHVINNSWGGGRGDYWYKSYVDAWIAAGIIPVFAQGNSGPSCSTANSPGDYSNVIGVGASNTNNAIASFSSRGPAANGAVKPDITAPGEGIRSVSPSSDTSYSVLSGTSMASPHVAGAVALYLKAKGKQSFQTVLNDLTRTAAKTGLVADKTCGGVSSSTFPNNSWGHGLINIKSAIGFEDEVEKVHEEIVA